MIKNIFEKIDFRNIAICAVLAAVFGGLAFASYSIQKKYYSEMEDNLINQYFAPEQKIYAQMIANQVENQMKKASSVLKIASGYHQFQNISSSCSAENKEALKVVELALGDIMDFAALINKNGIMICASEGLTGMEGKDISSQSQVQQVIATQEMVVSGVFINPLGMKIIVIEVPIFSDKRDLVGILGAAIKLENIEKIFTDVLYNASASYVAVLDSDGTVIYHPNKDFVLENVFGEKIQTAIDENKDTNNLFKNMLTAKSGHTRYFYQEEKIAGYAPINLQDGNRFWSVASTANLNDYKIFTESFFVKGLIANILLIISAFILIISAVYSVACLRERERVKRGAK